MMKLGIKTKKELAWVNSSWHNKHITTIIRVEPTWIIPSNINQMLKDENFLKNLNCTKGFETEK
jgi:hypothetical protein